MKFRFYNSNDVNFQEKKGFLLYEYNCFGSKLKLVTNDFPASWKHFPGPFPQLNVELSISKAAQTTVPAQH